LKSEASRLWISAEQLAVFICPSLSKSNPQPNLDQVVSRTRYGGGRCSGCWKSLVRHSKPFSFSRVCVYIHVRSTVRSTCAAMRAVLWAYVHACGSCIRTHACTHMLLTHLQYRLTSHQLTHTELKPALGTYYYWERLLGTLRRHMAFIYYPILLVYGPAIWR
jgi:hypothetical protein